MVPTGHGRCAAAPSWWPPRTRRSFAGPTSPTPTPTAVCRDPARRRHAVARSVSGRGQRADGHRRRHADGDDVLRPRLGPRRRPVAVRRPRPSPRGPGGPADPRPLLRRHDARHEGSDKPIRVLVLTGFAATAGNPAIAMDAAAPGRSTESRRRSRPTQSSRSLRHPSVRRPGRCGSVERRHAAPCVDGELAVSSCVRRDRHRSSSSTPSRRRTTRIAACCAFYLSTTVRVVNELGLDTYLRGVVPVEMPASWPAEAIKAQAIAARSYAARRLRPGEATTTSSMTPARRSTAASRARPRRRTPRSRDLERRRAQERVFDRQCPVPFDRRRRDRTQRERLRVGDRRDRRGAGQLPARFAGSAAERHLLRCRRATRDLEDRAYTRSELSAIFAADSRTNVGANGSHRPDPAGRFRPPDQRDAQRQRRERRPCRATSSGRSSTPTSRPPSRSCGARSSDTKPIP